MREKTNNETPEVRFLPAGEGTLDVEFGNAVHPKINAKIRKLVGSLRQTPIRGIIETVPTFRSLMIVYDPCRIGYDRLVRKLKKRLASLSFVETEGGKIIEIPVCYGGEFGEDLGNVAAHAGLSPEEVIRRHSKPDYLIYMLGFLPGFVYLGGLDKQLVTPRLATPRTRIPAGSVGIGGEQTGIYPLDSPGGWQLIGRTPLRPYDPAREEPIFYRAGDSIRFRPIDVDEYHEIEAQVAAGTYRLRTGEGDTWT